MHIAIVGAGPLGYVYGTRLADTGHVGVTYVRHKVARQGQPFHIEQLDGARTVNDLRASTVTKEIPGDADLIILAVGADQLAETLSALTPLSLKLSQIPLIVIAPLFPGEAETMSNTLGAKVCPLMPGVVAYFAMDRDPSLLRYWAPHVTPTLIDERFSNNPAIQTVVAKLNAAGLAARFEAGVERMYTATVLAVLPLAMALSIEQGIDALLADKAMVKLALQGARESAALAKVIGHVPSWAEFFIRFVGPRTLPIGVALARRRAPDAVFYVENTLGQRWRAQHAHIAKKAIALAQENGLPSSSLERLFDMLRETCEKMPRT